MKILGKNISAVICQNDVTPNFQKMRFLGILRFSDIPVIIGYLSKHFIDFLVPYGNPFFRFLHEIAKC